MLLKTTAHKTCSCNREDFDIFLYNLYNWFFSGIEHPKGFAVDWVSMNLYVTSSNSNINKILVCSLKGEFISTIFEAEIASESNDGSFWEASLVFM